MEINHPPLFFWPKKRTASSLSPRKQATRAGLAPERANEHPATKNATEKNPGKTHSEIIELLGLAAMTIILSTSIAVELPQGLGLVWEKTSNPDIARKVHHE